MAARKKGSANQAAKTPVVAMRLPDEVLTRADALVSPLGAWAELQAAGGVTRSTVLRLALLRGLDALEAETHVSRGPRRGR